MTVRTGVQVVGLNRTISQLQKLGADVSALKEAWEPLGRMGVTIAKAMTPVGATGGLKKSVRASKKRNGVTIRVGYPSKPYAVYPHFGTKYQGSQLWMFNALESINTDGEVEKAIRTVIIKSGLA